MAIVTRPDLDALEALLAKATPGPWARAEDTNLDTVRRTRS